MDFLIYYTVLQNYTQIAFDQSVAKPKTIDISTSLLMLFSSPSFLTRMRSSATATTYEKSSKEKPKDKAGNRMASEVWVEMLRV